MNSAKFKVTNYITVPGFAIVQLKLSGNELLCFSLVYGLTQDGETEFYGSLSYIASALNVTRQNAHNILDRLIDKGLIIRKHIVNNGVTECRYVIPGGVIETATGCYRNNNGGVIESITYNKDIDKKNINNRDNRESACACGDAPTPPISESLFADDNDYVKEERKRAKRTNERRKILFADSKYFDYDKFAAEFTEEEHRKADIYAYYQAIKNWSASDGGKKMDWIATAKKWMLMDEKKGKLIRPGNQGLSPEELKYLQDMAPSDFELGITR